MRQKIIGKDKGLNKIIQPQRLYEIIAAKADNLLQEVKKTLSELDYQNQAVEKIIVTGGGSVLEGFLERAEEIFQKRLKIGFLYAVNDHQIQAQSAVYATSVGLIHFGAKFKDKRTKFLKEKNNPITRMLNRAKGLYQEYF